MKRSLSNLPTAPSSTPQNTGEKVYNRRRSSLMLHGEYFFRLLTLACFSYAVLLTGTLVYVIEWIALPLLYQHDKNRLWCWTRVTMVLVANISINWTLFLCQQSRYTSQTDLVRSPLITSHQNGRPEQTVCIACAHVVPPRAHHCVACRACVLRRDHHCFFAGACVGHRNQRFFIVLCFYFMLGTGYATYLIWTVLHWRWWSAADTGEVPISDMPSWWSYVLPFACIQLATGSLSPRTFSLLFIGYMSSMAFLATAFFFSGQVYVAARGQTSHEWRRGIHQYRSDSWWDNLARVFGGGRLFWWLNFLVPLPSKPVGDGVTWRDVPVSPLTGRYSPKII